MWNWKLFWTIFGICMIPWCYILGVDYHIRKTTAEIMQTREQIMKSPFVKK